MGLLRIGGIVGQVLCEGEFHGSDTSGGAAVVGGCGPMEAL